MDRRVNVSLIKEGIEKHDEDGLFRAAKKCRVSPHTLARVRAGYVPKKKVTRDLIAEGYGKTENQVFPLVRAGGKAS